MATEAELEIVSCVRGFHVYRFLWNPVLGEELICRREIGNAEDRYAVGVYITEENALVGHLPRRISLLCSIFLRRGGNISCKVSGARRYSADLPQGGLEIPCYLLFKREKGDIRNLKKGLKKRNK